MGPYRIKVYGMACDIILINLIEKICLEKTFQFGIILSVHCSEWEQLMTYLAYQAGL